MEKKFIQKKYFCKHFLSLNLPGLKMKSTPILVCLAFIFSLASCTKELSRENPTHSLPNRGTFYATIDGQSWNGDSIQQAVVADGALTITGVSQTGDALAIVLPGLQTGVYALNAQSAGYALFTNLQDTSNLYLSNSIADSSRAGGIVSLTSVDTVNKTVSGTFRFNLYQGSNATSKSVTAGVFTNISYGGGFITPPNQPPASGNTDTLTARVDNTDWKAAQVVVQMQSGILAIVGISGQQTLAVYMPVSATAGTYALDFASGQYFAAYNPTTTTALLAMKNGSLTILENDVTKKHIRGNFSFTGTSLTDSSSATVTAGYFSSDY
jgi:hypothetical protein